MHTDLLTRSAMSSLRVRCCAAT